MIEVIIHIANKKVINMKEFRDAFNQLKDGKHLVTVKDMRRRSVPRRLPKSTSTASGVRRLRRGQHRRMHAPDPRIAQ